MVTEDWAVLVYRVKQLEETVHQDHEARLRKLEGVAARVAVFAAGGSIGGAAIVTAIINYFFTR